MQGEQTVPGTGEGLRTYLWAFGSAVAVPSSGKRDRMSFTCPCKLQVSGCGGWGRVKERERKAGREVRRGQDSNKEMGEGERRKKRRRRKGWERRNNSNH